MSVYSRIECKKCGNEQVVYKVVYNKASTVVKCLKCGVELASRQAGKQKLREEY